MTAPKTNLWAYLKRIKKPYVPTSPLNTSNGIISENDKLEELSDNYEQQFKPTSTA